MAKKAKLDETLAAARQFRALLRQQLQKAFASQSCLEEAPVASSCCCCGHSDVGVVRMVAALQDSQRRRLGADGGVDDEHRRATRRTLVGDHPQDRREDEVWTLVGDHPQAALDELDNVLFFVCKMKDAASRNYVLIDFIVLDIDCNPSCPIILVRPFLRTIGAVIDMKEGNIKFQFPLTKGMEHFSRTRISPPYESIMRASYGSRNKDDKT
ncbi:hypothetical protein TRIUR3_35468 [Triticum urartu]|uniref:Uncharacterized protein n=1 Tax=Triticum urartu TaxID=4572 RepID=M8AMG9_TRIUA|nr:hypothetical protein TRIUR3_35468 [Triticum urartu]